VESNPVKGTAPHALEQTQALQNRHAFGHKALSARLFSWELRFLKELHGQASPTEHDRERGARDTTACNENIGHRFFLRRAIFLRLGFGYSVVRWVSALFGC
jgi:hypothetical protein